MFNILNGGVHGGFTLDIQEFMVVPQTPHVADAILMGQKIREALKKVLEQQGITPGVGDEGGFTIQGINPSSTSPYDKGRKGGVKNEDGLKFLMAAIEDAGYTAGRDVMLALDVAASEFYNPATGRYALKCENKELTATELSLLYQDWLKKYPIVSLEDPFAQDDWEAWQNF